MNLEAQKLLNYILAYPELQAGGKLVFVSGPGEQTGSPSVDPFTMQGLDSAIINLAVGLRSDNWPVV